MHILFEEFHMCLGVPESNVFCEDLAVAVISYLWAALCKVRYINRGRSVEIGLCVFSTACLMIVTNEGFGEEQFRHCSRKKFSETFVLEQFIHCS